MQNTITDQLLTADDVIAQLRIRPSTLARLRQRGELEYVRVGRGRTIRYTARSLAEFVARRTVAVGP